MMPNRILVDSSFLYALQDRSDKYNKAAVQFVTQHPFTPLVPDVALTEVAQMVKKFLGERAVLLFLDAISGESPLELEGISKGDIQRARSIMETYSGARLDFVDCCLMAISERLNITQICTFDRRDFSIFRPKHCDFLELLP
jgi:uncharacterized protein